MAGMASLYVHVRDGKVGGAWLTERSEHKVMYQMWDFIFYSWLYGDLYKSIPSTVFHTSGPTIFRLYQ